MKRVYIEQQAEEYEAMFLANGWGVTDILDPLNPPDLIQFIGGADVDPGLYGRVPHPTTHFSRHIDEETTYLYLWALRNKVPMTGICRGSQFLCVMGGGELWQDVDNHALWGGHAIVDRDTQVVVPDCSSTHHQQHRPADNAIIIAVASPARCTFKERTNIYGDVVTVEDNMQDVEAFYYEHINALGFQPHPEHFDPTHPCQKYYFEILNRYLGV